MGMTSGLLRRLNIRALLRDREIQAVVVGGD